MLSTATPMSAGGNSNSTSPITAAISSSTTSLRYAAPSGLTAALQNGANGQAVSTGNVSPVLNGSGASGGESRAFQISVRKHWSVYSFVVWRDSKLSEPVRKLSALWKYSVPIKLCLLCLNQNSIKIGIFYNFCALISLDSKWHHYHTILLHSFSHRKLFLASTE